MFRKTTKDEFLEQAKTQKNIAVFREVSGDQLTPAGVFQTLSNGKGALLESGAEGENSRYSFLGFDPIIEFQAKGNQIQIKQGDRKEHFEKDPFEALRETHEKFRCKTHFMPSKFTGGAIGYVAYDAIRQVETIPDRHPDPDDLPDLFFQFYRTTISFDHLQQRLFITVMVEVDEDPEEAFLKAEKKLDELVEKIQSTHNGHSVKQIAEPSDLMIDIDDEEYGKMVEQAKEYIRKGDIFQVVLSRRFQKRLTVKPFNVYRALRFTSPSPYMFYIENESFSIAGASPEELVSVRDGIIQTTPIAGTRRLGEGQNEEELIEDLMKDEKELAEHMMLVDLGRNDLGSVAKAGSVNVKELKIPKKFPNLIHITSVVAGEISDGLDSIHVLRKMFPAGTLSGAPKIRAMEIIDELESSRRGLYGGAICAIDHMGNLESCIAIRMTVMKDGVATVRAGGGIVYDSDPLEEAKETRGKAKTVLSALEFAEGGNL